MNYYLITCGIALNCMVLIVASLCLWHFVIWPAVEAVSLTRMSRRIAKVNNLKTSAWQFWWVYFKRRVGGCNDTYKGRSHGLRFLWEGVGKWEVYGSEKS